MLRMARAAEWIRYHSSFILQLNEWVLGTLFASTTDHSCVNQVKYLPCRYQLPCRIEIRFRISIAVRKTKTMSKGKLHRITIQVASSTGIRVD